MPRFTHEQFGLQGRVLKPVPMGRFHHHSEIELNFVFQGRVTYLYRWERRGVEAGRLTAFWGAVPHNLIAARPGTKMAWITVPLAWVQQWRLPPATRQAFMNGDWCVESEPGGRYPTESWVKEIRSGDSRAVLLEVQAAFLRLEKKTYDKAPKLRVTGDFPAAAWRHVEQMARFMSEHFTEEIGVNEIARSVALHPKYAMTVFRRGFGITLHDYLERQRIAHAQRLLVTSRERVVDIAFASGFRTVSSFYERFGKVAGKSPASFRAEFGELQ